jgi:putative ABC transport system permease protein
MDLFAAERAFTEDEQVNQIDVVAEPDDIRGTKERISAMLPSGLTVEEPEVRKDVLRRTIAGFQAMITAFGFLAVLAGFVVCYSRLQSIVAARTWEAGLLRAIGIRRLGVFAELLKESLLVGATGAALGLPAGLIVARFGIPFVAATTALNFRLPVPSVEVTITAGSLVLGAIVGVLAALLATLVPAFRLARTQPVIALRSRGREMRVLSRRFRWGLRGALATLAAALIVWQHVAGHPAIGLVTTGIIVVIAVLIAAPLTETACNILFALCGPLFGPRVRLAVNHLREHTDRTSHTVATLGLGLGTVLLLGMLGWSFEQTLVSRLVANERSDMVISSAFASGGYRTAPLAEGVLQDLARIDGIALAVGQQGRDIVYQGDAVVLASCDAECFTDRRIYDWPLQSGAVPEALKRVASGQGCLVSTSFARSYDVRTGTEIVLDSPRGPLRLVVEGISGGEPESAVWISRDLYKGLWNDSNIWTANVALESPDIYARVAETIQTTLGVKYHLALLSNAELIEYFASEVRRAFALQYLLEGMTLLLIAIAIGDALASGVFERIREIGMMRAIGLQRSDLFGIIMVEGVTIVSIGLVMAILTGLLLGIFWVKIEFPALLGWDLDLHFPFVFALTAASATVCLGAIASFLPAWHAAHLPASEAIRHE